MQIRIDGVEIEVVKKKIKNLNLTVLPPDGRVRVSAPLMVSDEIIAMFVRTKLGWIRKQQARFQMKSRQRERTYTSGETLSVWGRRYILQLEHGGRSNSLVLDGDRAVLSVRKESTAKQREAFVNEWYRAQLKTAVAIYLPKWEQITGLHCSSWQSKNMTTRWGTCNTGTRKIWLNLQLAKKPLACLEYVILHELAHLKVKNHGADFVAILDRYMPGWREVKKQLNDRALDA